MPVAVLAVEAWPALRDDWIRLKLGLRNRTWNQVHIDSVAHSGNVRRRRR